jgi:hypothetical protein
MWSAWSPIMAGIDGRLNAGELEERGSRSKISR